MPLHAPTVARLDAMPSDERTRLVGIIGKYPPDVLGQVEESLRKNGVPEDSILDLGSELLDQSTPGGFGQGAAPDAPAEDAGLGGAGEAGSLGSPGGEYVEPELSTGGTIVDVLGKLMGGIAAGMSTTDGNSAMAAQQYVRRIQSDQQARRDSDRKEFEGRREREREDIKFSWEQKSRESAAARMDPNSPESRVVQAAAEKTMTNITGQPLSPEKKAELAQLPADQMESYLTTFGKGTAEAYARERDLIGDDFKRQRIAASQANAAASREGAAASRASTDAYRQAMLGLQIQAGGRADEAATRAEEAVVRGERREDTRIAEAERKATAPPAPIKTGYVSNRASIEKIKGAISEVQANPDAFGMQNIAGSTVMQRVDPGGVKVRANVAKAAATERHDVSGAAVTVSENPKLEPFIPEPTDNAETVIAKLTQSLQDLEGTNSTMIESYPSLQRKGGTPAAPPEDERAELNRLRKLKAAAE